MVIDKSKIEFSGQSREMLDKINRDKKNISAFGLQLGERVIYANQLFVESNKSPLTYICADYVEAKKVYEQFKCINETAIFLPSKDDVLGYRKIRSQENNLTRLDALAKYCDDKNRIVVTTVEAVCQLFPRYEDFVDSSFIIEINKDYVLEDISKKLINAGYVRAEQVEGAGQFSIRGDIVDIFSVSSSLGVRIEFFGDTCESIKEFDPFDQKARNELTHIVVTPNTEIFYCDGEVDQILKRVREDIPKINFENGHDNSYIDTNLSLELSGLSRDMSLTFIMPLLPHESFFDFFKPSFVVYDDIKSVYDNLSILYTEHQNRYKADLVRGDVLKSSIKQLVDKDNALRSKNANMLAFHAFDSQNRVFETEAIFNFKSINLGSYSRNLVLLSDDVRSWLSNGYKIYICCQNAKTKEHMRAFFSDVMPPISTMDGKFEITHDYLEYSAVFHNEKVIFIGTSAIVTKSNKKVIKRGKKDVFSLPSVGTYVVHNIHGIGFFESVSRLKAGSGVERDYAVLLYRDGDKLFVPIESLDTLSSYGESEGNIKLSKMGGKDFSRIKEKVKASVSQLAINLVDLYAKREMAKGHRYSPDDSMLEEFENEFIYAETDDQIVAIKDCINDLKDGKVMDRLICGDVGYGKTEVALRTAYKVISEGKQVAFLSPTTILARQHYNTVCSRMASFGVNAASLTRFNSAQEINKTLHDISLGKVDIVCGTHRLLSKDVNFSDLGLLILDEEQRFGVGDKEKIKSLKANINVLTLSATPIPRTLHMSLSGMRDISVLDTPPLERIPIKTYVSEFTDSLLYDSALREINRGGQVFIVYNRVATIDSFANRVKSILGDSVKVSVAHGQMKESFLENVISEFANGQSDVLIASTIIENGIDMPNANTLIVYDADKFGLSQLYQLRGRVGRSNKLAYAYFTFETNKILSQNAFKRLDAITQFTDFGSGFKIAMRDLEIRGAGNVLGKEQHGHIEKVGYDMYYKILSQAIAEISGEDSAQDRKDIKVITDFSAFIPDNYVTSADWRMRVYSRISQVESINERTALAKELNDVYGKLPSPVENLMLVALIKNLAQKIGANGVTVKKKECFIEFSRVSDIKNIGIGKLDIASGRVYFGTNRVDLLKFLLLWQKKCV